MVNTLFREPYVYFFVGMVAKLKGRVHGEHCLH